MSTFSELFTSRLKLRRLGMGDASALFRLRSDAAVNKYLDRPICTSLEEAKDFVKKINKSIHKGENYYWAIQVKNDPLLLGTICIFSISEDGREAEIGYELDPVWQGKGIMQEAMGSVLQFAFDKTDLVKIEAYTHPENIGSTRLLKKFGFKPDDKKLQSSGENLKIYSLGKQDFQSVE